MFSLNSSMVTLYSQSNDLNYQVSYQEFWDEQKSFNSSDGIIKYIDKGEGKVI